MTKDASFEDGAARALQLMAQDADDLTVISSLVQDAVLQASDITWQRSDRRVVMLLNRLRREDGLSAERLGQSVERVRALLIIDNVTRFAAQGIRPDDADLVLSLLSVSFEETKPPSGRIVLTFAGDGGLRAEVDAVDLVLKDVTRPYVAVAGKAPDHDLE
jgi:hypothetical protein